MQNLIKNGEMVTRRCCCCCLTAFFVYLFGCAVSQLQYTGSVAGQMGLAALWHGGSQFPDHRLNPHPLYCKADSQPLDHKGSPIIREFLSENRLQIVCIWVEGYPPEFMSSQTLRTIIFVDAIIIDFLVQLPSCV